MRVEIARLRDELKTTMIYVTHDQVEAMTLADRIVIVNNGAVEQKGAPLDLYERPANRFVAGFLGQPKMNLLPPHRGRRRVRNRVPPDGRRAGGRHAPGGRGVRARGNRRARIRPDAFTLTETGGLVASVVLVERLGGSSLVHARVEGLNSLITVELPGTYRGTPQTPTRLAIGPDRVHVFASDGRSL